MPRKAAQTKAARDAGITWEPHGDSKMKVLRRHHMWIEQRMTGIEVHHCGHPTAHFPWGVYSRDPLPPEGSEFCGRFRHLAEAKRTAERLYLGEMQIIGGAYVEQMRDGDFIAREEPPF